MSLNTENIKKAFNNAAKHYDNECWAQKSSGNALIQLLKRYYPHAKSIIDLGCGTGITTQALPLHFAIQTFHAIDMAEKLLDQAKSTLKNENIHFHQLNFEDIHQLDSTFDILFANLSLHWSENLHRTLISLKSSMHEKSLLGFSIPLQGTFDEISPFCSINTFSTQEQIISIANSCGLEKIDTKTETLSHSFENAKEALYSLKSTGAHYVLQENRKPFSIKNLKHLLGTHDLFPLTYQVGYFIFKKMEK